LTTVGYRTSWIFRRCSPSRPRLTWRTPGRGTIIVERGFHCGPALKADFDTLVREGG
jgi:hypothetical protein